RAGDEGFRRQHLQAGLEDEPGVADLVGLEGIAAINQEDRDRPTACRNHVLRNPERLHRTDRNGQAQALAARDLFLFRQGSLSREVDVHLDAAGTAMPVEQAPWPGIENELLTRVISTTGGFCPVVA